IAVRPYGAGTETPGALQLLKDVTTPLGGRHVLMVEDVIDTGLTTSFLYEHVAPHRPASLRLVSLLDKPGARRGPHRLPRLRPRRRLRRRLRAGPRRAFPQPPRRPCPRTGLRPSPIPP